MANSSNSISWEAEEYIVQSHNTIWYIGLFVITVALCVLAFFLQWWTFLILVVLSAITILISTLRPPRRIKYSLNQDGLTEGNSLHKYEDFRAFGILKENSNFSAVLIPKKRFALSVKVYFPGNSGEAIVDALGARLPMEEVKMDFLDFYTHF